MTDLILEVGLPSDSGNIGQENSEGEIFDKLQNSLDGDSSNSSSDEDEPSVSGCCSTQTPLPNLSKEQLNAVVNSSKCMEQLCRNIQSLGHCPRFHSNTLFFSKSNLTLFHSGLPSSKESSTLHSAVSNHDMGRVNIPPNGNCFFVCCICYNINLEAHLFLNDGHRIRARQPHASCQGKFT